MILGANLRPTSREGMNPRPEGIALRKISKIDQRKNRPSR
jgi:hypothetical protein